MRRIFWLIGAMLAFLLVACGSKLAVESSPTPTSTLATIPAGTYTVTFTAADNIQVGDSLMTGDSSITFAESGDFTVRASRVVINGRYTTTEDQVTFEENNPSFPCADAPTYAYGWKMEGDQLTFSTIEDACHLRTLAMTLHPYVREE